MNYKKNNDPIYLDQDGYNALLESVEKLKAELQENNLGRREAFNAGAGDGWDSPEFEEIERENTRITGEIQRRYEELERVVIIEKQNNQEIIDIGDVVSIDIITSPDSKTEMTLKLVGSTGNFDAEIQEVSVNSPLGSAIYQKKVGDTGTYLVNDKKFSVLINAKIELEPETGEPNKKL